jgi:RNA methyltransferase, TrmH family
MLLTPSNRQFKNWRKLQQKKYRLQSGKFLAEGERCVEQILKNGYLDVELIIQSESSGWEPSNTEWPRYRVKDDEFIKPAAIEPFDAVEGVIVAADRIQDPGNLGTILRTAAWFGARALICGTGTADPYHPKVVRSSAGATGCLGIIQGSLKTVLADFETMGWEVMILDAGHEAQELHRITWPKKTIIVVGNEANGVSPAIFKPGRAALRIGGDGQRVESLNAAISVGIVLYSFHT